ncbi:MAG: hypothetical protein ACRDG3_02050 [Tepidiformaceae bacterium]
MTSYTLRGRVTDDHRLEVELPPETPPGDVDVTVTARASKGSREAYLALLDKWKSEPLKGPRRTREEVDAELQEMRHEWDRD